MAVLSLSVPVGPFYPQDFEDVASDSVYFSYVEAASHAGIVGGYPCGTNINEPCIAPGKRPYFRLGNSITRGQLAKMVVLARNWTLINPSNPTFSDVPSGSPFYTHIETGHAHNVLAG
ncbi:MAG: S-layer homology domain-containing protein [Chloroflexota bacterium]|nr:S-layer homology domain-containing protein [Chloroflexota bacterium]